MSSGKNGIGVKEVVIAVALGGLAAGGAALTYNALSSDPAPMIAAMPGQDAAGPDRMVYEAAPFDRIASSGPQEVTIALGEEFSVRSEGSPQALSLLEATVENGRLTIRPKSGFNWGNWRRLASAKFFVTLPELREITIAGSGILRIDRIEGESFAGTVGGSGEIVIGEMKVEEASLTVNGSGTLTAAGTANRARLSLAGSGDIRARRLHSETASVSVFGSGDAALTVSDDAQVSITGSGDVDISGPGRCSVTRVGSGDVRCEGGGGT